MTSIDTRFLNTFWYYGANDDGSELSVVVVAALRTCLRYGVWRSKNPKTILTSCRRKLDWN